MVRKGLRGRPLFQLPADREDRAERRTPHITFYGDQPADYQTDVFTDRAVNFVNDKSVAKQPFWLNLWFNSPHGPFDPAPRDLYRLSGTPLPKLPGFNEKDIRTSRSGSASRRRSGITKKQAQLIDNERRRQEEQLISVDQAVGELVQTLKDKGILDDTYIIFSSDNGFFRGEHRIVNGKYLPYDPASRVPLIIRGPGIPAGGVSNELVWNGDIPQTILQIASGSQDNSLDGRSFLPFAEQPQLRSTRPVLLEGDTGPGRDRCRVGAVEQRARSRGAGARRGQERASTTSSRSPTRSSRRRTPTSAPAYRSIRTDRYEYTIYANGQTELYDMQRDPAQLHSLAADPRYRYVRKWLYTQLIPLSACAGPSCRVELGPDPAPLSKKALRPKGKRKKGQGAQQPPTGKKPAPKT